MFRDTRYVYLIQPSEELADIRRSSFCPKQYLGGLGEPYDGVKASVTVVFHVAETKVLSHTNALSTAVKISARFI